MIPPSSGWQVLKELNGAASDFLIHQHCSAAPIQITDCCHPDEGGISLKFNFEMASSKILLTERSLPYWRSWKGRSQRIDKLNSNWSLDLMWMVYFYIASLRKLLTNAPSSKNWPYKPCITEIFQRIFSLHWAGIDWCYSQNRQLYRRSKNFSSVKLRLKSKFGFQVNDQR